MSRFRTYDNSHNRNKVRIDARPQNSEATQAGMRNVHRGMSGEIVGGVTAEGAGFGTKARRAGGGLPPMQSKIGKPNTPGLDKWAAMNPMGGSPKESFAATEKRKQRESASTGAFGAKARRREFASLVQGPPSPRVGMTPPAMAAQPALPAVAKRK